MLKYNQRWHTEALWNETVCFRQSQPDDAAADDKSDAAGNEAKSEVDPGLIVPAVRRVDHASAPGGTKKKTCGSEVFNHSGSSVIKRKLPVVAPLKAGRTPMPRRAGL